MARAISFINYKGGVGKTTLSVNLAATLAHTLNRRVLLLDGDPQSNSSIWMLRLDRWNKLNTRRADTLVGHFLGERHLADLRHTPFPEIPQLQVIPATFSLMDLEQEWVPQGGLEAVYERFRTEVQSLRRHYDYILFDCPPNVYRVSKCALLASDEVFVPANPDALSLLGLSLVAKKILDLHRNHLAPEEFQRLPYGGTKIRSLLLNALKSGAAHEGMLARLALKMRALAEQGVAWEQADLCPHQIRDAVLLRRLPFRGKPVCLDEKGRRSAVARDFEAMAQFLDALPTSAARKVA
ncbi:MAG: ParA family protein [Opitutales bacterium]